MRPCEGCGGPNLTRNRRFCSRDCYFTFDPPKGTPTGESVESKLERFSTPEPNTGCWLWVGGLIPQGCGMVAFGGKHRRAHKAAYEALVGPVPDGLVLDHLCRQRSCVNPSHLEPVTQQINAWRGAGITGENHRKTTCKRGHPYVGWNLMSRGAWRGCRTCKNAMARVRRRNTERPDQAIAAAVAAAEVADP